MTIDPRGMATSPTRSSANSHAIDHPKRRVEAERLHDYLSRKFEFGNVAVAQGRVAEHGIKLLPHPFEAIWTASSKDKEATIAHSTMFHGRPPEVACSRSG